LSKRKEDFQDRQPTTPEHVFRAVELVPMPPPAEQRPPAERTLADKLRTASAALAEEKERRRPSKGGVK